MSLTSETVATVLDTVYLSKTEIYCTTFATPSISIPEVFAHELDIGTNMLEQDGDDFKITADNTVLTNNLSVSGILDVTTDPSTSITIPDTAGPDHVLLFQNGLLVDTLFDYMFQFTIQTDNLSVGSTALKQFQLPLVSGGTYNMIVSWGDGFLDTITAFNDPATLHTYSSDGTYEVNIQGTCQGWVFNGTGDRLKMLNIKKWGPNFRLGTTQGNYFKGCSNLQVLDTSAITLTGTTNLQGTFQDCSTLNVSLNSWTTTAVTNMSYMFSGATKFNNGQVTTLIGQSAGSVVINPALASYVYVTLSGSSYVVSNVLTCPGAAFTTAPAPIAVGDTIWIIYKGASVTQNTVLIDGPAAVYQYQYLPQTYEYNSNVLVTTVSAVTATTLTLNSAIGFDLPAGNIVNIVKSTSGAGTNALTWNTSAVQNMSFMFNGAALFNQDVRGFVTSSVLSMESMFSNAYSFNCGDVVGASTKPMSAWTTNTVTSMKNMFNSCYGFNQAVTYSAPNVWNTSAVTDMSGMFNLCSRFNNGQFTTISTSTNPSIATYTNSTRVISCTGANFNSNFAVGNVVLLVYNGGFTARTDVAAYDLGIPGIWVNTVSAVAATTITLTSALGSNKIGGFIVNILKPTVATAPLNWNTSLVQNTSFMFNGCLLFNQDVTGFDTSKVTSFESMFASCLSFNFGDVVNGNNKTVNYKNNVLPMAPLTSTKNMFSNCCGFNQSIISNSALGYWNTSSVTYMSNMFYNNTDFNNGQTATLTGVNPALASFVLSTSILTCPGANFTSVPAPVNVGDTILMTVSNNILTCTVGSITAATTLVFSKIVGAVGAASTFTAGAIVDIRKVSNISSVVPSNCSLSSDTLTCTGATFSTAPLPVNVGDEIWFTTATTVYTSKVKAIPSATTLTLTDDLGVTLSNFDIFSVERSFRQNLQPLIDVDPAQASYTGTTLTCTGALFTAVPASIFVGNEIWVTTTTGLVYVSKIATIPTDTTLTVSTSFGVTLALNSIASVQTYYVPSFQSINGVDPSTSSYTGSTLTCPGATFLTNPLPINVGAAIWVTTTAGVVYKSRVATVPTGTTLTTVSSFGVTINVGSIESIQIYNVPGLLAVRSVTAHSSSYNNTSPFTVTCPGATLNTAPYPIIVGAQILITSTTGVVYKSTVASIPTDTTFTVPAALGLTLAVGSIFSIQTSNTPSLSSIKKVIPATSSYDNTTFKLTCPRATFLTAPIQLYVGDEIWITATSGTVYVSKIATIPSDTELTLSPALGVSLGAGTIQKIEKGFTSVFNWNTSQVLSTKGMFYNDNVFNLPIKTPSWNFNSLQDVSYMFYNCFAFNQSVYGLVTSNVTNTEFLFRSCWLFNQSVQSFNTSNVTSVSQMFYQNRNFNQNLSTFNTSKATNMSNMLGGAWSFNNGEINTLPGVNLYNCTCVNGTLTCPGATFTSSPPPVAVNDTLFIVTSSNNNVYVVTVTAVPSATTLTITPPLSLSVGTINNIQKVASPVPTVTASTSSLTNDILTCPGATLTTNVAVNDVLWITTVNNTFVVTVTVIGSNTELTFTPSLNQTLNVGEIYDIQKANSYIYGVTVVTAFYTSSTTTLTCPGANFLATPVPLVSVGDELRITTASTSYLVTVTKITGSTSVQLSVPSNLNADIAAGAIKNIQKTPRPINTWDTSSATNLQGVFQESYLLNQPIVLNTTNCLDLSFMLYNCVSFNNGDPYAASNRPFNLDTANCIMMRSLFSRCFSFNQRIDYVSGSIWDTSKVNTNNIYPLLNGLGFSGMFNSASVFNQYVGNWVLNSTAGTNISLQGMFDTAIGFNNGQFSGTIPFVTLSTSSYDGATKNITCPRAKFTSALTGQLLSFMAFAFSSVNNDLVLATYVNPTTLNFINGGGFNVNAPSIYVLRNIETLFGVTPSTTSYATSGTLLTCPGATFTTAVTGTTLWLLTKVGTFIATSTYTSGTTLTLSFIGSPPSGDIAAGQFNNVRTGEQTLSTVTPATSSYAIIGKVLTCPAAAFTSGVTGTVVLLVTSTGSYTARATYGSATTLTLAFSGSEPLSNISAPNIWDVKIASSISSVLPTTSSYDNTSQILTCAGAQFNSTVTGLPLWIYSGTTSYYAVATFITPTTLKLTPALGTNLAIGSITKILTSPPTVGVSPLNWNTTNVTSLRSTFSTARLFNQPVGSWNTSKVTTMQALFNGAITFNQDVGSWNVSLVTIFAQTFSSATLFNNGDSDSIKNWSAPLCTTFQQMFVTAASFNQPLQNTATNTKLVNSGSLGSGVLCNCAEMFNRAFIFNQNIGTFDMSKVSSMFYMFYFTPFNNDGSDTIKNWNAPLCTTYQNMFDSCFRFNQPLDNLLKDSTSATNCFQMFSAASVFNQNLNSWNVSKVTSFSNMFARATQFNNGQPPTLIPGTYSAADFATAGSVLTCPGANFTSTVSVGDFIYVTTSNVIYSSNVTLVNSATQLTLGINYGSNINAGSIVSITKIVAGTSDLNWTLISGSNIDMLEMFRFALYFNQKITTSSGYWNTTQVTNVARMFEGSSATSIHSFNNGQVYLGNTAPMGWNLIGVIPANKVNFRLNCNLTDDNKPTLIT